MSMFDYSADGITWVTDLPQPSDIDLDMEDLDTESYRSVLNGNIVRNVVGYKWQKIGFEYKYLTEAQADQLGNVLKSAKDVYIRVHSPIDNDGSYVTVLRGYVSKVRFKWIQTGASAGGYSASFNFVEGTR